MQLDAWTNLTFLIGFMLCGIGILISIGPLLPSEQRRRILSARQWWRILLKDYKNSDIAFGGPLGLTLRMVRLGAFLLAISGLLWVIERFLT